MQSKKPVASLKAAARKLLQFTLAALFAMQATLFDARVAVAAEATSEHGGAYVGVNFAIVYAPDEALSITPVANAAGTADSSLWLDYDLGFRAASLSAGYAFRSGFRAELEAGYWRNELEVLDFSDARGTLNTGAEDAVDAFTGFANLYYDFKPQLAVQPYLGAGIGFADIGYKTSFSTRVGFERIETGLFNERDTTLAWQVVAGASMALTARTRLSAEYRYWRTAEVDFTDTNGASYTTRHKLHMATLGVKFSPGLSTSADTLSQRQASTRSTSTADSFGVYVAARFGALAAEDSDLDDPANDIEDTNFDAFDLGPAGAIAVGYAFDPRHLSLGGWPLRAELEASLFDNEADVVDFGKLPGEFRLDGKVKVKAIALNLLAERRHRVGLTPYAGIGIGYADVDYDLRVLDADSNGAAIPGAINTLAKDSDGSITVQGLLGVSVALRDGLQLSLGYRYWWAPILRLQGPDGGRLKTEHSAHAIHLGLRFGPR